MVVYIASSARLVASAFDPDAPNFFVTAELGEFREPVRQHFTLPFIYYVGSHTHCGCGFAYGPVSGPQDVDEDAAGRQSVDALREYLTIAAQSGPVEIYSCWSADESDDVAARIIIGPDYFSNVDFAFPERQLATFVLPDDRR